MDFLIEIGCEEIPARFIDPALANLGESFLAMLSEARLNPAGSVEIHSMGTPRRLALQAGNLPDRQEDLDEQVLGPRVEAAFDSSGNPTKACLGFAKSRGVEVAELSRVDTPKGQVVALRRQIEGQPTGQVLAGKLPELLGRLAFPKTMRWGTGEHQFARPVHWLLVLLDDQVIDLEFAGVRSGRKSRGHRFTHPEPFDLGSIGDYPNELSKRDVLVDPARRRELLVQESNRLATEAGGKLLQNPELEAEIAFLTEKPVPLLGKFQENFLKLPREVLVAAMRNHQRYFCIQKDNGQLLNSFVAVGNTPVEDPSLVRHGNERVLTARLNDAGFFFDADRKQPLTSRVPGLQNMLFQADLGSYYEKVHRVGSLAVALAFHMGLGQWERPSRLIDALSVKIEEFQEHKERYSLLLARAALLSKTDLLTEMVGEFPELQGVMGEVYAEAGGENPQVATAIREHYLPRFANDEIPQTDMGALVSLADRLDTLAGCFGVGLKPTGAADPYALRRQCLAVISILLGRGYHLSLDWMLQFAIDGVFDKVEAWATRRAEAKAKRAAAKKKKAKPEKAKPAGPTRDRLLEQLRTFFAGRLRQRFSDGARTDVVDAVLAAGMDDILDAAMKTEALSRFVQQETFADLAVAFKRVANIIKDFEGADLDPKLFTQPEENRLHQVYQEIHPDFEKLMQERKFPQGMELLAGKLREPVDRFFDEVLVNDPDDLPRQNNRKALLSRIEALFGRIADFTKLQF